MEFLKVVPQILVGDLNFLLITVKQDSNNMSLTLEEAQ